MHTYSSPGFPVSEESTSTFASMAQARHLGVLQSPYPGSSETAFFLPHSPDPRSNQASIGGLGWGSFATEQPCDILPQIHIGSLLSPAYSLSRGSRCSQAKLQTAELEQTRLFRNDPLPLFLAIIRFPVPPLSFHMQHTLQYHSSHVPSL